MLESRETLWTLAERFQSKERAPLLALIQMNSSLPLKSEDKTRGLGSLFKVYWERFGSRGCVMDDLRHHLKIVERDLEGEEIKSFIETQASVEAVSVYEEISK